MRENPNLHICLLSILQRGITEARTCVLRGDAQKAADLVDALDSIPRHLHAWNENSAHELAEQLAAFHRSYPDHDTNYPDLLNRRVSSL
jgi:hypothetical protein